MNKASFTSPNSLPDACTLSAAGSDGPDRIKQFTYNGFDQVLTETRALGTSLVQTYVTNIYSGRQLVGQIDANGNRTDLYYDANGRLKRMIYPSPTTKGIANGTGTGTTGDFVEFTYDANGNKKTERKRNGALITYTYDANSRPIFKDLADNTKDVCFDYDLRGLQKQAHFSSNYTTTACTNSPGITNTFDGFGNIATATTNQLGMQRVLNYTYDLNNNRTSITHPDGTIFSYSFDKTNRVLGVSDSATPNNNVLTVNYQANGRRQSITRNANSATTTQYNFNNGIQLSSFVQNFPASTNALTNSFTYNAASQIQSLTKSNSIYYYTGSDDRNGAYVPDGLNRYKTVGASTLDYDLNSNLYRDGSQYYSYDDENRLVGASGTNSANIVYDPNGRLFQTTINGTSVQYLYDGDALVAEYNTSGTLLRRYIHGDQVDEPWVQYNGASLAASNRRYLHSDHQGSIIAHSDVNGSVLATLAYDTYGIPKAQNISVDGAFAYTGQIRLTGLGLYHYKARAYDPKLGRFLQTDPIGYKDNYNLYAYVGNDPVNKADPTGRCETTDAGGGYKCKYDDSFFNGDTSSDKRPPPPPPSADGALAGGAIGGEIGVGLSVVCDFFSGGVCVAANPAFIAGGAALGAYIGSKVSGLGNVFSSSNRPGTRDALHSDLTSKGFTTNGTNSGGYTTYKGPNGKKVDIKPSGEVIPTQRVWKQDGSGKFPQRTDYEGNVLEDQAHFTDHFVEPVSP